MQIDTSRDRTTLTAVLGPTNTGKTHLAMERMLAHNSGVIGFPLRLLARENYDRAVKEKGAAHVALVTGEEKIIPAKARYFLTTVESMPQTYGENQVFEFAAIDEIQMCSDADRGHVFTDRLLNYRGSQETMFMGAETVKGLIQALVPEVEFQTRPRLSTLRYTGYKKLTRLKPRSCIVAFSANDVYSIAELVRRQSGGAAIVMGALSPRTRNAQVDMFQSGDVDYLIATDAVGMGLNMDVDHVALAATRKFDGRMMRDLQPAELAQIAGRAGRHMNDGTFGTTSDIAGLGAGMVEAIEQHTFQPLKFLFWRNAGLDFSSVKTLKASLAERPEHDALRRAREADDEVVLDTLLKDSAITDLATSKDAVTTLWDVARIPDFRKIQTDEHPQLLGRIYQHITSDAAHIPSDWIDERVKRIHRLDGDIDTLMGRIAAIRTWTYVAHQAAWVENPVEWQERTRAIEDELSDVLHEKLTQRFVDKRTSQLVKTLKDDVPLAAALHDDGALEVEGHHLGHLNGFRFVPTESDTSLAAKVLDSAAGKALRDKITERVSLLQADADGAFTFTSDGRVVWRGEPVARFAKGGELLSPRIVALTSDLLEFEQKEAIEERLNLWASDLIRDRLGLMLAAREAPLQGVARGLVYQLTESLGALPRFEAREEIKGLSKEDRHELRRLGIRLGRHLIYIPTLLRPAPAELSVLLWGVFEESDPLLPPPPAGRVSLKREKHEPEGWLRAAGFRPAGQLFVRADMLERLAEMAWKRLEAAKGPFEANEDFLSLAGCGADDLPGILTSLGFRADNDGKWSPKTWRNTSKDKGRHKPKPNAKDGEQTSDDAKPHKKKRPPKKGPHKGGPKGKPGGKPGGKRPQKPREPAIDPDSPFAKLKDLKFKS
ncbi:helicase-related protein [Magnetovibrio sp. PR-2]|uniref:helicase-related protein n=1 Tax=Magnetovibrio sp. PR-2 TaxID=3120356 RepID=UPI002FCE59C8